jgi:hypothetical protein
MHTAFDQIEPVFNQFKNRANVEIELRLGKKTKSGFDTNVGKSVFEQVKAGLDKYSGWESVKTSNTTVYFKDDIRVIDDDDTGETRAEIKKKLKKCDIPIDGSPFDVRFCVATETTCAKPEDTVYEDMRVKHRTSYIRKNLSIDVTRVEGDSDPDSETADSYEIEFEIINPKNVTDRDTLYNMIHKIRDVLNLLSCINK